MASNPPKSSTAVLLLQVPWFADLAATAAAQVQVTADGEIALPDTQQQPRISSQQQLQLDAEQQAVLSHLLATLLAKLSQQHSNVATHILQTLMPQLLACQHAATGTTSTNVSKHSTSSTRGSSTWLSILCRTAAQLHAAGHISAQHLATACVEQLESCTADARGTLYGASALTLGHQACLQLLAALLQPLSAADSQTAVSRTKSAQKTCNSGRPAATAAAGHDDCVSGLQPELLQRLLQCVVPHLASGNGSSLASCSPCMKVSSLHLWHTRQVPVAQLQ